MNEVRFAVGLDSTVEKLRELARAEGRTEERIACATASAIHSQYPIETDYDRGYADGRRDAKAAILARSQKGSDDGDLERAAADLWRADNPQQSVFDCDGKTKVRYRRAVLAELASREETLDVQTQAERPASIRDNFSEDEIAAAFADQRTLDRVLDALDIANTDQDPAELIVKMVSHIEALCSTKTTVCPPSYAQPAQDAPRERFGHDTGGGTEGKR
jgi:hypothetical protein